MSIANDSDRFSDKSNLSSKLAFSPVSLLGLAAALLLLSLVAQRHFLHDDALISLRFAQNLVTHGALDWNIGERVEGYTNFLHLIATAALMKSGLDPVIAVRLVNATSLAGLFWALWAGLDRLLPAAANRARALGIFCAASSAPLALWLFGGLETVMAAALATGGVVLALPSSDTTELRRNSLLLAGVLLGAAVLTRPDVIATCASLGLGLLAFRRVPVPERIRDVILLAAPAAAIVLAHMAWRYSYYGELLPNTFHAKVSVDAVHRLILGFLYLSKVAVELPVVPISLALVAMAARNSQLSPAIRILTLILVVHTAAIVWAGGDHMPGSRMLVPMVGVAALLAALAVVQLRETQQSMAIAVVAGLCAIGALLFKPERMDPAAFYGSVVGEHLARTEKPGTLIALSGAGAIPYLNPQLRFIDMLGLIDPVIARRRDVPMILPWQFKPGHAKGDGAYVLSRKPDLIILGPPEGTVAGKPWFLSDLEIERSEEFGRCYRMERHDITVSAALASAGPVPHMSPVPFVAFRRTCPK